MIQPIDPASSRSYLSHLTWWEGTVVARPLAGWPREGWLPGIVRGVLGSVLRERFCGDRARDCAGGCDRLAECAYARLFEARAAPGASTGLRGVSRVPSPLAITAERTGDRRLAVTLALLGRVGELRHVVEQCLDTSLMLGLGRTRRPFEIVSIGWRKSVVGDRLTGHREPSAPVRLQMRLLTPLRLVQEKRVLTELKLPVLVRDLMLRTASWGHYHQGLPWPPPWREVLSDSEEARVLGCRLILASTSRYSARQHQRIEMGGLVGNVDFENVRPSLLHLLTAGEVMHAGKGASMGYGRYRLAVEGRWAK